MSISFETSLEMSDDRSERKREGLFKGKRKRFRNHMCFRGRYNCSKYHNGPTGDKISLKDHTKSPLPEAIAVKGREMRKGFDDIRQYFPGVSKRLRKRTKTDLKFYNKHGVIKDFNMPSADKERKKTWWDCGPRRASIYRSIPLLSNCS